MMIIRAPIIHLFHFYQQKWDSVYFALARYFFDVSDKTSDLSLRISISSPLCMLSLLLSTMTSLVLEISLNAFAVDDRFFSLSFHSVIKAVS